MTLVFCGVCFLDNNLCQTNPPRHRLRAATPPKRGISLSGNPWDDCLVKQKKTRNPGSFLNVMV